MTTSQEAARLAAAILDRRVPKGLPPAYHPFDGDGKRCAYCELSRESHRTEESESEMRAAWGDR